MAIVKLLFLFSSVWLGLLLMTTEAKNEGIRRLRKYVKQNSPKNLIKSTNGQRLLDGAGVKIRYADLVVARTAFLFIVLIISYLETVYLKNKVGLLLLFGAMFIATFLMSTSRLSISGYLLSKMYENKKVRRDLEYISFMRLYEANKRRGDNSLQFWAFCANVAPNFFSIKTDLITVSNKALSEDVTSALEWFEQTTDKNNLYMNRLKSVILSVEEMEEQEKINNFLHENSVAMAGMSSHLYSKRSGNIADVATYINVVPSLLSFIALVYILAIYLMEVNESFGSLITG